MNAVVQYERPQAIAPTFTMSDMERVALAIAKGGLFGSSDPNAVLTLCMLAQAEGQHPAVVFRDYHIISGKPAKKAEAMQRDFLAAGGKIEWHKLDDNECSATFSHPQGGSATISWDKQRVAQAELGGNKMHKKYPRQMLRSRVISEGVRTVFPMATSGLYETGEIQDMAGDAPATDTPPTPTPQRARDLTPVPTEIEVVSEPQKDPARAKAEEWMAWLRDEVASTAADAMPRLREDTKATRDKMQVTYPDLFAEATALLGPDDDPNPNNNEADESPAEAKAREVLDALAEAKDDATIDSIVADYQPHEEAVPQMLRMKIEVAISDARARVAQGVAA